MTDASLFGPLIVTVAIASGAPLPVNVSGFDDLVLRHRLARTGLHVYPAIASPREDLVIVASQAAPAPAGTAATMRPNDPNDRHGR